MLDTDERIALVNSRVRAHRRAAAKRSITALSSSCVVLAVCLVGFIASFSQPISGDVVGLFGASLLFSGAGGYVLVGIICFIVAVIITLGCVSYRRKSEHRKSDDGVKKDVDHD
ncbi:MAG: hypothetical protein Q4D34_00150 [Eggerthellaceae bacterium]|nr:hypothetical protein [Eggerthellaceae bacterium]